MRLVAWVLNSTVLESSILRLLPFCQRKLKQDSTTSYKLELCKFKS